MSKKQYDVSSILRRADQLGMVLYIEGAELKVLAPSGLPQLKKALEVIKEHKAEIIAHLRGQACALCSTCMDEGRETEATRELDGFMFCQEHWKAPAPTEAQRAQASLESCLSRAHLMADAIGGVREMNVHPASYTLKEHMRIERQEQEARLEARRQANRRRLRLRAG